MLPHAKYQQVFVIFGQRYGKKRANKEKEINNGLLITFAGPDGTDSYVQTCHQVQCEAISRAKAV